MHISGFPKSANFSANIKRKRNTGYERQILPEDENKSFVQIVSHRSTSKCVNAISDPTSGRGEKERDE